MKVGIRELKTHLSSYVDQARRGETIVITDHGKVVAQLCPTPAEEIPASLKHLVDSGRLIYKPWVNDLPPPIRISSEGKPFSDYVSEQRG